MKSTPAVRGGACEGCEGCFCPVGIRVQVELRQKGGSDSRPKGETVGNLFCSFLFFSFRARIVMAQSKRQTRTGRGKKQTQERSDQGRQIYSNRGTEGMSSRHKAESGSGQSVSHVKAAWKPEHEASLRKMHERPDGVRLVAPQPRGLISNRGYGRSIWTGGSMHGQDSIGDR
ncbi:uncharacterized protein PV07_08932 [Cladophialophora immunda]|uniref:Uncharacterized protein n=1 Tax=Cladophialophora immunda TaxID=569365 RepID=A0A0D2AL81_9EURO|nr:uncharacterized protein PV07_08932 [Cladophialophora immunda]KIW25782.1 hypothetical protein PV07_08932 [Cladophialophora immunda]